MRIKELKRIAIGGLRLKDLNIKEGEYRFFNYKEITNLLLREKI
jgi:16S rRNA U516 pseudouridylate synthase RsuA-like enzyme